MTSNARSWGVLKLTPSLAVLAEPNAEAEFPAALHSTYFDQAIEALRQSYDYVVIDGPAVLGTGDATVVESAADGVVLVARSGRTPAGSLRRAAVELGDRRILGVVLNDVPPNRKPRRGA
jgi:Mrp family chromosome partitioning ATPase